MNDLFSAEGHLHGQEASEASIKPYAMEQNQGFPTTYL
jgi:hypothetical protein